VPVQRRVVAHKWVGRTQGNHSHEHKAKSVPEFSTMKKCRNLEVILNWTRENAIQHAEERLKELELPVRAEVANDGV